MTQTHKYLGLSLSLLLGLSISSGSIYAANGNFGGGTGVDAANAWIIEDCLDLQNIDPNNSLRGSGLPSPANSLNHHYQIIPISGDTIDCSETNPGNGSHSSSIWYDGGSGEGFEPIGDALNAFGGHLEGNENIISNLYINTTSDYTGLFGNFDGNIYNLGVADADINSSGARTGIIAGKSTGDIEKTYITGEVTGANYTGGFFGFGVNTTVTDSYLIGTVSGANYTGGLVGFGDPTSIYNTYVKADISGASQTGGFAGFGYAIKMYRSYSASNITGTSNVGWLIGQSSQPQYTNSYYTTDGKTCTSCASVVASGITEHTNASSDQINNGTSYALYGTGLPEWDFTNDTGIWEYVDTRNDDFPVLQWQSLVGPTSIESTQTAIAASGAITQRKKDSAQAKVDYVQFLAGEDFNEALDPTDTNADNISNALKLMVRDVFKDQTVLDQLARTVEIFIGLTPNSIDPATRSTVPGAIRDWRCENGLGC